MKRMLKISPIVLFAALGVNAQSSLVYSLDRLMSGGDLKLVRTDLTNNMELEVGSYPSNVIDDIDPGITTFDGLNNRFVTLASDDYWNINLIGLNTDDGTIEYDYSVDNFELLCIEYYNGNAYSLARPIDGGDLSLVCTDLSNGMQTVIESYSENELFDYAPETTTFNAQNGVLIIQSYDAKDNASIVGIDVSNGALLYNYSSSIYELFSVEYFNGSVYSLARPINDGNLVLVAINLGNGELTEIIMYAASALNDYNPEATSFDHQHGRFVTIGYDQSEEAKIIAIDVESGALDYVHLSNEYELFNVEVASSAPVSVSDVSLSHELHVYPNPCSSHFTMSSNTSMDVIKNVQLINVFGQIVLEHSITSQGETIDVSKLAKGVYFVGVQNEPQTMVKLVVQ